MSKKKRKTATIITDEGFEALVSEGADPRLTKTGAAFNALLSRVLGVPIAPLSEDSAKFINDLDTSMRDVATKAGFDIRKP